jgi:uncharacterized RDD family membrane protein YckC
MNQSDPVPAPVGKRIGGGLVDLFLTWLLAVVIGAATGLGRVATDLPESAVGVSFNVDVDGWNFVAVLGIVFLLFALMEWQFGRTPGKMVAGTRVVAADGSRLGPGAALVRNLFRYIDIIGLYLVGLIVLLCNRRRARIGDLVAHSMVVEQEASVASGQSSGQGPAAF